MKLALTFDAEYGDTAAGSRNDPAVDIDKITSALYQKSIPATFFIQGRWALANPLPARRIADMGFGIGSHSFYHAPADMLSRFTTDVEMAQDAIVKVTGVDPTPLYRYPFGKIAKAQTLHSLGYVEVGWHWAPEDWNCEDDEGFIARWAKAESGIVLLHTWPGVTSSTLKRVIAARLELGDEFVGLGEFIG